MKNIFIVLLIVLVIPISTKAQILEAQFYDTVRLEVPAATLGNIQWQFSLNGESWENIADANTFVTKQVVRNTGNYFRAQITEPDCLPVFSNITQVIGKPVYLWSDPATWPNGKPTTGSDVVIPEGMTIRLNENSPSLGGITINGELEFARKDLQLNAKWIMVHGTLRIGTVQNPFLQKATITLTDTDTQASIMGMGTRGIVLMDGKLELHGKVPDVIWTKLNQHAPVGSTSISLLQSVDWKVGDELVIAPTDYYLAGSGISVTQKNTITSISGTQLGLNTPLNAFRWGLLQYATASGMSLEPGNLLTPPQQDTEELQTPLILDERAEVGNLTRNIVIQAPDDAIWQTQGFGVHIMIMGSSAAAHVDGVEIKRGGQRGRLRRYPFHWHMLSYNGVQAVADASGQYFKNSTIHTSRNRGIVIHGTNGVLVQNNIVYDVQGHGIFTEDAVERRNVIDGNLVLRVRNPPYASRLKLHEVNEKGSSGFWISNPDNTITNNIAADCGSFGFWLTFPTRPFGESTGVIAEDGLLMNPSRMEFGVFDNNTSHSNGINGIHLDDVENDNEGNTIGHQYASNEGGRATAWPEPSLRRFHLSRFKVWKNMGPGIWDRARQPTNQSVVSADNHGRFFAGSGDDGVIERSLIIGTSLNHAMNGTGRSNAADPFAGFSNPDPVAFATYHSTFDIRDNIVINFPASANGRSGVFSTEDYYTRPVDKGMIRNTNNLILNAHPGVKLRALYPHYVLASALLDAQGVWGPVGNYFVYNEPFFTHGKTISVVPPGEISGGVSVPGPFYGFEGFVLHGVGDTPPQNQPYMDIMGIEIKRLDNDLQTVATWTVNAAQQDWFLQHMRHFATTPEGIYELTFPAEAIHPTNFQVNVENMLEPSDTQVIGIQFDGNINASVRLWVDTDTWFNYNELNSLQQVINSEGETYWQDNANHRVWVKIKGGRWEFWTNNPQEDLPSSDELIYETVILKIF